MAPSFPAKPTAPGGRTVRLSVAVVAAALQVAAGSAPQLTEAIYARRAYPVIAGVLGRASGSLSFSLGEALCVLAAIGALWLCFRRWRLRREAGALARGVFDLAGALGALWLAFLACWGLNYQRAPFAASAGFDARSASSVELAVAFAELVDASNRLRDGLPEDARGAMALGDGRSSALARVASGYREVARRYSFVHAPKAVPKPLASSRLFSYLGITGFYFPFTAEANVNTTLPDVDLPFSAAHELAHRLGFAREDEASFLGYLACREHPDRDLRYVGELAASRYASAALAGVDRKAHDAIAARRAPAVRRDLEAIAEWSRRYRSRAAIVSSAVNDAYLRAQGERRGVASYGRMVDLLIAERRTRED